MNTPARQGLGQQLQRDLRRNPKKAALLALLAGVAMWFWAPLLIGMFRGEEAADASQGQAAAPVTASPVSVAPAGAQGPETKGEETAKGEAAAQTWQQLVRSMEQDPRRKADGLRLERDPFAPHKPPPKPVPDRAKVAAAAPIDPEKLGLKLTGTLLGPEQRVALINGRAYAEGQTVKASAEVVLVVRHVEAKRVILEHNGKQLVLQAVKPAESEADLISRPQP